jgi:hypothetical protein
MATRYEKLADHYLSIVTLAATVTWPDFADTP